MGSTNEEIVANCKVLAMKLTELYAKNFNKSIVVGKDEKGNDIVRPLSAEDIMIFWKVHETRDEKKGLQIHIHGIPSRKDIHNKYQLSPVTNHKGTQQGPVIGGFERTTFYKEVEKLFDETFDYNRKPEETFVSVHFSALSSEKSDPPLPKLKNQGKWKQRQTTKRVQSPSRALWIMRRHCVNTTDTAAAVR